MQNLHFKPIAFNKDNSMASKEINEVVVTDIKMSFSSMVVFMVKWAIATIPAIIILTVVGSITLGLLRAILDGFHQRMSDPNPILRYSWKPKP
jgi:hypothetical protein